jgi:hypothetical protein
VILEAILLIFIAVLKQHKMWSLHDALLYIYGNIHLEHSQANVATFVVVFIC